MKRIQKVRGFTLFELILYTVFWVIVTFNSYVFLNISWNNWLFLITQVLVNISIFVGISIVNSNLEQVFKRIKPLYWSINLMIYTLFIINNKDYVLKMFNTVSNEYVPSEIYAFVVCYILFLFFYGTLYILLVAKVNLLRISTQGVEIEVKDKSVSTNAYYLLNLHQEIIARSSVLMLKMEKNLVREVDNIYQNKLQKVYQVDYPIIIDSLLHIANELVSNINNNSVVVPGIKLQKYRICPDVIRYNDLHTLKKKYSMKENIFNIIKLEIDSKKNDGLWIFNKLNYVFVVYKFRYLDHSDIEDNIIVAIIEFEDFNEGFVEIGNILGNLFVAYENSIINIFNVIRLKEMEKKRGKFKNK